MRNYALHQAEFSGSLPGSGLLIRLIDFWRARKAIRKLDELDDHLLQDIGITRSEIERLRHLPLGENPLAALHDLSGRRNFGSDYPRTAAPKPPTSFSAIRVS